MYTDETTVVTDDNPTPISPFGTTTTMDAGDALFVRPFLTTAAVTYSRIYFNVSTPGVGNYSIAIRRFNPTTEVWDIQTIATDTTNGLRNAGVSYIDFTSTVHGATRLQQQDAAKQFWTKIEVATLTSVTTAPIINSMWFNRQTDC